MHFLLSYALVSAILNVIYMLHIVFTEIIVSISHEKHSQIECVF
jgi:hypothetical protein